jgi:putative hydrolase of the HAD superfamily
MVEKQEVSRHGPDLSHVETWVFDLDNTLYPWECDLFVQMDRRMNEFIVGLLGVDVDAAADLRQSLSRTYGSTMRGLMEVHGQAPGPFLDFVHAIDCSVVPPDPALDKALQRLPGRKLVFTNATERHAANVLDRLGISHHFSDVFDVIHADYLPKPRPDTYARFVRRHRVRAERAVMFEDMARNLGPAAALGMTTVWVKNGRPNAQIGPDDDFVHHVAEELCPWLDRVVVGESAP